MRSRGDLRRVMKDPAGWLASALGVGLIPWAPGTFGSAFALLLWWPMLGQSWFLQLGLLVVTVILSGWSAGRAERLSAVHDPGWIVIDEVVGQWLTLLLLAALLRLLEVPAPAWQQLLFGFACFRLFDVLKPWPISWADRHIGGGWGTTWDDLLAALYAAPLALLLVAGWNALGTARGG
ncbi:MAG: phosphatidylglycerophosphatase A [Xanthomonadales bacterium]|nr:phosphatidylglycerophosphatase A [Xanthomonadales bacterium]